MVCVDSGCGNGRGHGVADPVVRCSRDVFDMTISPESFAMICFIVLMQNGGGINDKRPDYITEKTRVLRAGYDAFAYLDIHNMRLACRWCEVWGVQLPDVIDAEMARQNGAAEVFHSGDVNDLV